MKHLIVIVAVAGFLLSEMAQAAVACSYAAYTPGTMRSFLTGRLAIEGMAAIPSSYFKSRLVQPGDSVLTRDTAVYGFMTYEKNHYTGTEKFSILDSDRHVVALAEELITPCHTGLCRESRLTISLRGNKTTLSIGYSPGYGVTHYSDNAQSLNGVLWRAAFDDYVELLINQLMQGPSSLQLTASTREQALAIYLAVDPWILPYMPSLTIFQDSRGRLVLQGRMNHGIYDRIISTAIDHGFYDIVPQVVIDSAAVIPSLPLAEDLLRCY